MQMVMFKPGKTFWRISTGRKRPSSMAAEFLAHTQNLKRQRSAGKL